MPKSPVIAWTVPNIADDMRLRSAIVGPYRVTIWRREPGSWAWEVSGRDERVSVTGSGANSIPAYYGAPNLILAKRDAVAWVLANADHVRPNGRPPVVWAVTDNRRRPFLANPGGVGFMVEPSAYAIQAAADRVAAARKRDAEFMAERGVAMVVENMSSLGNTHREFLASQDHGQDMHAHMPIVPREVTLAEIEAEYPGAMAEEESATVEDCEAAHAEWMAEEMARETVRTECAALRNMGARMRAVAPSYVGPIIGEAFQPWTVPGFLELRGIAARANLSPEEFSAPFAARAQEAENGSAEHAWNRAAMRAVLSVSAPSRKRMRALRVAEGIRAKEGRRAFTAEHHGKVYRGCGAYPAKMVDFETRSSVPWMDAPRYGRTLAADTVQRRHMNAAQRIAARAMQAGREG